jgi:ribosomal protein S18 acetylase RimI-like enzyme
MIQTATKEDAVALHSLVNSAYRGELSKKGWASEADLFDGPRITLPEVERLLSDPTQLILKYVEKDQMLGCVLLHKENNKLYLGMFAVDPILQGKGIGKKLLHAGETEALKQRCVAVYMTVITLRANLLAWYHKHGYADTGKRIPFDKDDVRRNSAKVEIELAVLEKKL